MPIRSIICLIAALALSAPIFAQSLDAQQPDEGSLGTVVRLLGNDLVGKKYKATLTQDGAKAKKTKLKVLEVGTLLTEGEPTDYVDVLVKSALVGEYVIVLQPKGKGLAALTTPESFEIMPPRIVSVAPEAVSPGETLDIVVDFPGVKKLKARVGGKKAKVLSVTPSLDESPFFDVSLRLPKIPNGKWSVSLQNRLGKDSKKASALVEGSKKKLSKPGIKAVVGGKKFKASSKRIKLLGSAEGCDIVATSGKRTLTIGLPIDVDALIACTTFDVAPSRIELSDSKGGLTTWNTDGDCSDTWRIDIQAVDAKVVSMELCGTLCLASGEGDAMIELEGTAVVRNTKVVPSNCNPDGPGVVNAQLLGETAFQARDGCDTTLLVFDNFFGGGSKANLAGEAITDDGRRIQISFRYDPNTDSGPETFDTFPELGGLLYQGDTGNWSSAFDPLNGFLHQMSVTVSSSDATTVTGTFTGMVTQGLTELPLSGSFVWPWVNAVP